MSAYTAAEAALEGGTSALISIVSISEVRASTGVAECIGTAAEAASVGVIWERGAIVGVSAVIES
jgi:hypothetical protein